MRIRFIAIVQKARGNSPHSLPQPRRRRTAFDFFADCEKPPGSPGTNIDEFKKPPTKREHTAEVQGRPCRLVAPRDGIDQDGTALLGGSDLRFEDRSRAGIH